MGDRNQDSVNDAQCGVATASWTSQRKACKSVIQEQILQLNTQQQKSFDSFRNWE